MLSYFYGYNNYGTHNALIKFVDFTFHKSHNYYILLYQIGT